MQRLIAVVINPVGDYISFGILTRSMKVYTLGKMDALLQIIYLGISLFIWYWVIKGLRKGYKKLMDYPNRKFSERTKAHFEESRILNERVDHFFDVVIPRTQERNREQLLNMFNYTCGSCSKKGGVLVLSAKTLLFPKFESSIDQTVICINCLFEQITPNNFEKLVGQLFEARGFSVRQSGGPGDEGVDFRCWRESTGELSIVQCKRYNSSVGAATMREFYGSLVSENAVEGFFVTTGDFTNTAERWVKDKPITLIGRRKLRQMLHGERVIY